MLEQLLQLTGSATWQQLLLYSCVSLILGFMIAFVYMKTGEYTTNFAVTLVLLPILVQTVIIMVNGNIGTGIAVAGAFSLIRFRSVPGTSREISSIFFAMAVGLSTGIGELLYAFIFTVIVCLVMILLKQFSFGMPKDVEKSLKIVIPEALDYSGAFDEVFNRYLSKSYLESVKTTNLGSMYELFFKIQFKNNADEKKFIDDLRCRNGNLPITLGRFKRISEEL